MVKNGARLLWVDLIRVIAVFAVIVVHVAAYPTTQMARISAEHWWAANAYDSLARPAVPLFIMLTGALLLPRRIWDPANFAYRRLARVAAPFLAWCLLYAIWNYGVHGKSTTVYEFAYHLVAGMSDPIYSHLWYLPLILSLYLLTPVVRVYVLNSSLPNQLYFFCLWIVSSVIRPAIESRLRIPLGYYLEPAYGYVGYFVLGATLSIYLTRKLKTRWLALCIISLLVSYIFTLVGTYLLTASNEGRLDEYFYSHFSPNVIIMSIASFVLIRELGIRLGQKFEESNASLRLITFAGTASFGIYLLHMMVFDLLNSGVLGIEIGPLAIHPAISIPSIAIVVFILSLSATSLIQQSLFLRWLVP
jgi:surface polysaccharide O-acyltransferase-like enzyme